MVSVLVTLLIHWHCTNLICYIVIASFRLFLSRFNKLWGFLCQLYVEFPALGGCILHMHFTPWSQCIWYSIVETSTERWQVWFCSQHITFMRNSGYLQDAVCIQCGNSDSESLLLRCGTCGERACHTFCMDPPAPPPWYCPGCAHGHQRFALFQSNLRCFQGWELLFGVLLWSSYCCYTTSVRSCFALNYPDATELLKIVLVHHYVLDIWLDGLFNIGLVCTFLLSSFQVTSSGCYVWASQIVSAASW